MTRRVGFQDKATESKQDPEARRLKAFLTFAMLETPLVMGFVGVMIWLFTDTLDGLLPPSPSEGARTMWLVGTIAVFGLCVGLLYAKVLWPVLKEARDAAR
ncbi:hypothetical protein [Algicella marina]|uniref:DUF485 domain-containing protein n=1 Tax=Algicella marina TaxID=2683284 RepID=A0A6P1SYA5_9RHOB|nr:hypothetical protein [Algicella marina]QHQ34610.1 hypothetical protein GO499_05100 [Algicella marina]